MRLTPGRLSYRGPHGNAPRLFLDLSSDTVRPGMSGAAVLNLRSGGVCGVIVASKNPSRPDGALAVHWSAIETELASILVENREAHKNNGRWEQSLQAPSAEPGNTWRLRFGRPGQRFSIRPHETLPNLHGNSGQGRAGTTRTTTGMTGQQIQRVVASMMNVPMLGTSDGRKDLMRALRHRPRRGGANRAELQKILTLHVARGETIKVLEALRWQVAADPGLQIAESEACWRRQERIAPVLPRFRSATRQQVRTAYFHAVPDGDDREPDDLEEAMDLAASHPILEHSIGALHKLVAHLENLTGIRMDDNWYQLPDGQMKTLRKQAARTLRRPVRLVIDLRDPDSRPGDFEWPHRVLGYLLVDQEWRSRREQCESNVEGVHQAIARIIEWVHRQGISTVTVGFIISRAGMDALPEDWRYGDDLREPTPLSQDFPVVLHSAERLTNPLARAYWMEKVVFIRERLDHEDPDFFWIEPAHRDSPRGIRAAVQQTEAACFGFAFTPGTFGRDLHHDPIVAAVAAGAPFVLWPRNEPLDWPTVKQILASLAARGSFEDFPKRLQHTRLTKSSSPIAGFRLIWDQPEALPPFGELLGLTDGNDTVA